MFNVYSLNGKVIMPHDILVELKAMSKGHKDFKKIEALFEKIKSDAASNGLNEQEALIKTIVKSYTSEAAYRDISLSIVNGLHARIGSYVAALF